MDSSQAEANHKENYEIYKSLILNLFSSDFEVVHMSTCSSSNRCRHT